MAQSTHGQRVPRQGSARGERAPRTRSVRRIVASTLTQEGAGFEVSRPFPTRALADFDPFLLLDEMGPIELAPGEARGAPDHPHRGFETITYVLEGSMEHRDSRGYAGTLGAGDVQWMTAGSGVVHSEVPSAELAERGGRMHGFQIWVNLPRRDKMMPPRYQEISTEKIPVARSSDGEVSVKVIAGEAMGRRAAIETRVPILCQHFTLEVGAAWNQPVPGDANVLAYVFEGHGLFGPDETLGARGDAVLFEPAGSSVAIRATKDSRLELLLLGGAPLHEPVVRYGPFVMNNRDDITRAFQDYEAGRMGRIDF